MNVRISAVISLLLGLTALAAYLFIPFAVQPELGPSTAAFIAADRDNNVLEIETSGLQLILLGAALAIGAGVRAFLQPKWSRAAAAVTALGGDRLLLITSETDGRGSPEAGDDRILNLTVR